MGDVMEAAAQLNKRLVESAEYTAYLRARERLCAFPKYKEAVDTFRKRQVMHEIRRVNGEASESDEFALASDYADICLITVCNDFFQAEMTLLELIKAVDARTLDGLFVDAGNWGEYGDIR